MSSQALSTPTLPPSLSERLQAVTEALAAARTQRDVFEIVLTPALQALSAIAGAVLLVDSTGERLDIAATQGYEEGAQTIWQDGPLDANVPAGDALARHRSLFFEHEGDLVRAYPHLEDRAGNVAAVATAVLPMFLDDQPLGAIILDFKEPHHFTPEEQRFLQTLAAQCAIALGRAQLMTDLQRQVNERTVRAVADTRAQQAFVDFTEAVGTETDLLALAWQAISVLRDRFQDASIVYYTREGDLWKAQAWSEDLGEALVASLTAGLPSSTPLIRRALQAGKAVFTNGWDPEREQMEHTEGYGTAAGFPLMVNGEIQHLLLFGLKDTPHWQERDRALVRVVGRSLTLAVERTEAARMVQAQKEEAERRNQVLEGFAALSAAPHVQQPYALIRRAQEIMLSLLTPGYALYWEQAETHWVLKAQVGDIGNPELQRLVDEQGLPLDAPALHSTWLTGVPNYQDNYAQGADTPADMIRHVNAATAFQVRIYGQPVGMLAIGLFDQRTWTPLDKAMLDTAMYSLSLLLERAQNMTQLAQRTQELERSNAELEQFAYIASHDLQAPIRAVTSFAGIINKRYGERLDERGQLYLRQIVNNGEHMKRLVDDLLAFSRLHTEQRPFLPTDAETVFDAVASRLQIPEAVITRSALPVVQADAQQLDQLLQNLISNGLKYRRADVTPEVQVSAERDGEFWHFTVSDNGIGIEPQYYERIFVIFQRLHGRETYEGTGIGLAVCKKIVERHGGRIWLESVPGQGTSFHFTLPEG